MLFYVVIELTKRGPQGIYQGPSERQAQAAYCKLEHGTIQCREGSTGRAKDGSVLVRESHK
jgi:hypothetical protein